MKLLNSEVTKSQTDALDGSFRPRYGRRMRRSFTLWCRHQPREIRDQVPRLRNDREKRHELRLVLEKAEKKRKSLALTRPREKNSQFPVLAEIWQTCK